MDAFASAPTPSGAEPPWLAIVLASIAVLGPIGVAYMASRNTPPPATPSAPETAAPVENLALIREVLADALEQRDAANTRARQADERTQQMEDQLTEARIHIARLEARGRYGP